MASEGSESTQHGGDLDVERPGAGRASRPFPSFRLRVKRRWRGLRGAEGIRGGEGAANDTVLQLPIDDGIPLEGFLGVHRVFVERCRFEGLGHANHPGSSN